MPHLEEQFPPINPLVLLRPDALDPPDREEEEETRRTENRAEDEAPLPGSLADGIDRVTISANARVIAPVQPLEETVPLPADLIPGESEVNPAVPELLDIETQRREVGDIDPAAVEIPAGPGLRDFTDGLEANRRENRATATERPNTVEPSAATPFTPATPISINLDESGPREIPNPPDRETAPLFTPANPFPRIGEQQPLETAADETEQQITPDTPPARGPALRGQIEPRNLVFEEIPQRQETQGLRGDIPIPRTEERVNILTPSANQPDPPVPNIEEARNFGQGRTLSLDLATAGNENTLIAVDTVDEALEEGGAIPGPETGEELQPELLIAPAVQPGFVPDPDPFEEEAVEPDRRLTLEGPPSAAQPIAPPEPTGELEPEFADDEAEPAIPDPREFDTQGEPEINPETLEPEAVVSSLTDTRQVFEDDQETQALQPPAFPELDNDEPFIPNVEPEAREEDIPAVVQAPLNVPPPVVEDAVPVAPPVPGSVEALDENSEALRRNTLGTELALRSNRELRNFLQEFNNRIEPPEQVTESAGGPITEVQNNAPPPPDVFENLEAVRAELLNDLREQAAREGVTRPEEERIAPPEPRTPESLLTGRGQNIDRFI